MNNCKCGLCIKCVIVIIFTVLYFSSYAFSEQPVKGVITGDKVLNKKLFYQGDLSDITYITQGVFDNKKSLKIGICSYDGMHIISPDNGKLINNINFKWGGVGNPEVLYSKTDDNYYIAVKDLLGDVGLMDNNGNILWRYEDSFFNAVHFMVVGDLNRDDEFEFYVSTESAIYRLDKFGNKVWKKGRDPFDIAIFDPGQDKDAFLVTVHPHFLLQGIKYLNFRNFKGELIKKIKPKIYIAGIAFVNWPDTWSLVTGGDINVLDLEGNIIFQDKFDFTIFKIRATTVRLFENQPPYLAVVGKLRAEHRKSIFCVYSPDKKIFYKEVIGKTTGLLAKKSPHSKCETLLVGDGPGRVYEYKPRLKKVEIGRQ